LYELKNSMLPIVVLHDVNIEYENYKAQLDFVIVTHRFILIIEVKKLFGNVKITDKGEFQRVITKNNRVINKEGMYSPLNQVDRHVAILDKYLKDNNIIKKMPIYSVVTFANPKTILDISIQAPKNIKSRIIRHDQIKIFLSNKLKHDNGVYLLDDMVMKIANFINENNVDMPFSEERYITGDSNIQKSPISVESKNITSIAEPREKLQYLRTNRSKEMEVKPYYVFTNKTLEAILEKQPRTIQDLLEVEGIGPKKAEEFGKDILEIINGLG
jgi:hypothetical protein